MKTTNYTILLIIVSIMSCKAQSPIVDINDRQSELVDGAYLKDVYNELDKFVGTWVFIEGSTSLTIKFEKKILVQSRVYRDLLVGEYSYVEDGIEKINTLSMFDNEDELENLYEHNLIGSLIIYKKEFPGCSNCDITEKRVKIDFSDPSLGLEHLDGTMYMGLRFINELTPKLQIDFAMRGTIILPDGAPIAPNLPFGRYLLIKQ